MAYFPVPDDAFKDSMPKSVGDYLAIILNWLWSWIAGNLATCTSCKLHVYADGTSGDDANDGLSASTPKKTLQAVFDLVAWLIGHHVCVHLSGVFADSGVFHRMAADTAPVILIDGGSDVTVVADNGGSPWVADIVSTSSIGLTTAGWTIDAYRGYWVEVLTGPAAGQTRQIFSNTATTLSPIRNFTVSPGPGAQFRIVRPATTIDGALTLGFLGGQVTAFAFQRLSFGAASYLRVWTSLQAVTMPIKMSHIVSTSSSYNCFYGNGIQSHYNIYNPATFVMQSTGPTYCGCSFIGASTGGFALDCAGYTLLNAFISDKLNIVGGQRLMIDYASRITNMVLSGMAGTTAQYQPNIDHSSANFRKSWIGGGTGVGLLLLDSVIRIKLGDFSTSTSHGIEARNSRIQMEGIVTGTGNGGAGVYAHTGSEVTIKSGAVPTLTGTVGNLAVTSPTVQESTWAAIDAGTPVAVLAEMTMAKEVA